MLQPDQNSFLNLHANQITKGKDMESGFIFAGYAPGNYINTCINCKQEFSGDKRAVSCDLCAFRELIELAERIPVLMVSACNHFKETEFNKEKLDIIIPLTERILNGLVIINSSDWETTQQKTCFICKNTLRDGDKDFCKSCDYIRCDNCNHLAWEHSPRIDASGYCTSIICDNDCDCSDAKFTLLNPRISTEK